MNLEEQIESEFRLFGEELSQDLKESAVRALTAAGRKSPQTVKLDFSPTIYNSPGQVTVIIRAVNGQRGVKYWDYIEEGRRPGARGVPADALGKKWQNENNIDARKVLADMRSKAGKPLKAGKKSLDYNKAVKSLSFIIQRSIKRKGIRPKPYIQSVLSDGRIERFRERLTPLLGESFVLRITGIE